MRYIFKAKARERSLDESEIKIALGGIYPLWHATSV